MLSNFTDHHERLRLQALVQYDILDTETETAFDDLAQLAAQICGTPTALVSLVDEKRQWLKSCIGLDVKETPRDQAFCAHTILDAENVLIIEDATRDSRFRENPLVTGEPGIRFYAGAPLVTSDGFAVGSLCVIDYQPRQISAEQITALKMLAKQVVSQMDLRRATRHSEDVAARYQQLLDEATDGIYTFDFDGKILSVNPQFCQITGRTEAELLGLNIQDLVPAEDLRRDPIHLSEKRSGNPFTVERQFQRPDGSLVTVELSGKAIDPQTIQTIARDITERRRAEQKLLETERRFRDFLNSSLALFCTHELDGTLLSVSPAAARSLSYTESELIGENLSKFLLPEIRQTLPLYLQQLAATGESRGLMNVVTKSGERRIWSYSNVVRENTDGTKYVLGSSQDVTALKRSQEELEKSQKMFRSFINNSPTVIFLKDENGVYEIVNRSFEELVEMKFEDLAGKTDFDIFPPEIAETIRANDYEALESEVPLKVEEFIPASDGTPHYWLSNKFCFKDETGKRHVGGVAINISKRKQMEEELRQTRDAALESVRLKSSFLTNISHEIRSPMNGIMGMSELLLDTALDRTQRDYAQTIKQSGDALLTIINDILDLGKIESGKLRFENIDFDLRETIDSTVEILAERAFRKNLEIAALIEPDVPTFISGDPGRLRQVLTNLIGNAVKFTHQGEIGVHLKVEQETPDDYVLRFTITDTGIGIAPESIKNLFHPFVQVDNSLTRQYGGTGLGLAISKQLVEMMNGEITVESQLEKGSRFSFTARFAKQQSPRRQESSISPDLPKLFKNKKILVADRSEIIRESVQKYVAVWNVRAVSVATGEEVLREIKNSVAENQPFDAVVIDSNLPDWDGFALTQRIRSDFPSPHPPVILTTAFGQRGDASQAKNAGAAGYLIKPIRGAQFFDCLTTVFRDESSSKDVHQSSTPALVTRHSLREAKTTVENVSTFERQDFSLLVVEDNEINRRLLSYQLTQLGLSADVAFDGIEALEKMAKKNYQVILMDCQMPRLDGYETTRKIRRQEREKAARGERLTPVSIIALTAHTFAGERERCLAAGMDDYLPKPSKVKDLFAAIEFWSKAGSQTHENLLASETLNAANSSDSASEDTFDRELRQLFVTETARQVIEMKQAIAEANASLIASLAHAARGNALALSYRSLAEILNELETAARVADFSATSLSFEKFLQAFERLQIAENSFFTQYDPLATKHD